MSGPVHVQADSLLGVTAPGTLWHWGLVGLRGGLDAVEKTEISYTRQNRTPLSRLTVVHQV